MDHKYCRRAFSCPPHYCHHASCFCRHSETEEAVCSSKDITEMQERVAPNSPHNLCDCRPPLSRIDCAVCYLKNGQRKANRKQQSVKFRNLEEPRILVEPTTVDELVLLEDLTILEEPKRFEQLQNIDEFLNQSDCIYQNSCFYNASSTSLEDNVGCNIGNKCDNADCACISEQESQLIYIEEEFLNDHNYWENEKSETHCCCYHRQQLQNTNSQTDSNRSIEAESQTRIVSTTSASSTRCECKISNTSSQRSVKSSFVEEKSSKENICCDCDKVNSDASAVSKHYSSDANKSYCQEKSDNKTFCQSSSSQQNKHTTKPGNEDSSNTPFFYFLCDEKMLCKIMRAFGTDFQISCKPE